MAVTFVAVNSATGQTASTTTTAGTASITATLPTGTAIGDRVYVFVAASNTSGTTPASWTALFKDVQVGVTGTAPGSGTGRRYISVYYRDRDTTWTMPAFTLTSATNNSHALGVVTLRKDAAETWDAPTFTAAAQDTTDGTGYSVTSPSWTTATGGYVFSVTGLTDNVSSGTPTGTATGMTLGTRTERVDGGVGTGNIVRLVVADAPITTGGTGTITRTATLSAASQGGTAWLQQTVTPPPSITTFSDDFTTLDTTTKWGTYGAPAATGGQLVLAGSTTFAGIASRSKYDLTGASCWVELVQKVAPGTEYVYLNVNRDASNKLALSVREGGTLVAMRTLAGVESAVATGVPYNATNHRWLRISESGGTLTWATSPDGVTWNTLTTATVASLFPVTAMEVELGSGYVTSGSGTTIFDNLNVAPPSGQNLQSTASSAAGATDSHSWTMTSDVQSSASSSAGAVDSASTTLTAQRSPVDTAGAVDSVSTSLTAARAATDTAGATDTATWSVAGTPGAGETFGITGTSFTLTGLTAGTKYTLQVRSREPQSVSAWSDPVEFTTTVALPTGAATGTLASTDSTTAVNPDARMGINSNLWLDNDAQRTNGARGLQAALTDLKPKIIRYPGGEKSDGTIFFQAANQGAAGQAGPNPRLSRIGDNAWPSNDTTYWTAATAAGTWAATRPPYALTTFLAHCQAVGAEPLLVVALDSIYSNVPTGAGIKPTKAQIITNAQEFVRWCNVTNSYNVRYWEIGNEPWLVNADYFGGTADPTQYAADFADVAAAMKAIDPTIKVGANGDSVAYFDGILNTAAASVDFLTVHPYDTYQMAYSTFQTATLTINQLNSAVTSLNKQPAQHRDRIWITATETAHLPASNTDTLAINNLGSAIITAHYLGLQLKDPRIRHVVFWNSRWIYNTQATKMAYDAFAPDNTLLPVGRALQFLGQLSGRLVTASSGFTGVEVYASQVAADARSSVLIVNRSSTARAGTVGMTGAASVTVRQLTGTGPTDTAPALNTLSGVTVTGGVTSSVSCPANSLTLLDFGY